MFDILCAIYIHLHPNHNKKTATKKQQQKNNCAYYSFEMMLQILFVLICYCLVSVIIFPPLDNFPFMAPCCM